MRTLALGTLYVVLVLTGGYITWTTATPWIHDISINPTNNSTTRLIEESADNPSPEDTLYIPAIDLSIPYSSSGEQALNDGAWWRKPENGSPADGGNFVLAAHRFELAPTPAETRRKSPLYSAHRLKEGDSIVVDHQGQRYTYEIARIYRVKPTDIQIEDRTDRPQLTLYTCTLNGSSDGRDVIIAYPKTTTALK